MSASHEELRAGDQLTAIVRIADRLGNPTKAKPDELRLVLEGPSGRTHLNLFNAGSPVEGVHIINEELLLSGSYTLTATIRGSPVLGAPIGPIRVRACPPEGYYSTIVIPRDAVAKFPTAVIVRCRDRYGNL